MNKITEVVNRFSQNLASTYQRVIIAIQNTAERIATHQNATDFEPQFAHYQRLYPDFDDYRCNFDSSFSKEVSKAPPSNDSFSEVLLENDAVQQILTEYRMTIDAFIDEKAFLSQETPSNAACVYESAADSSLAIDVEVMTTEPAKTPTANELILNKEAELKDKKQQLFQVTQELAQCRNEIKRLKAKVKKLKNQVEEVRKIKVQLMMKYGEMQTTKLKAMQLNLEIIALENDLVLPSANSTLN